MKTLTSSARRRFRTSLLATLLVASTVGLLAAPALAQSTPPAKPTAMTPPTPPNTGEKRSPWIEYVVIGVLGLMVMGVNCMPSKRGHQD